MCSGEACALCGAGLRSRFGEPPCEHDVLERHELPPLTLELKDLGCTIHYGIRLRTKIENVLGQFVELHARLVKRVSEEAAILGVTRAYVHPERFEFFLVGPEWTEEFSLQGAATASKLQRELSPNHAVFIEGSFEDSSDADTDDRWSSWCRAF